jgi:hypothetical protein
MGGNALSFGSERRDGRPARDGLQVAQRGISNRERREVRGAHQAIERAHGFSLAAHQRGQFALAFQRVIDRLHRGFSAANVHRKLYL